MRPTGQAGEAGRTGGGGSAGGAGPSDPAVRFDHAAVQVAGRTIWSDVSLTVEPG